MISTSLDCGSFIAILSKVQKLFGSDIFLIKLLIL